MADVFISYASEDRLLALKISALLESYGYSTWWDAGLKSGEAYRDNINSELTDATAVVVIWSTNSINSDWVRAEAGRAQQQKKLLPLKTAALDHDDIPLPFGEMHTEKIDSEQKIVDAVAQQILAKPSTPAFWKVLRHDMMTWVGISGTVITLTANLRGVLQLANWIRYGLEHWVDFITLAWSKIFFFLPKFAATDAILLTLFLFMLRTFFTFRPETYDSMFARELWLERIKAPFFERLTMAVPVMFCVLAFVIGYLDLLGATSKQVLTGKASIPPLNDGGLGIFSSALMNHLLLDLPGNWQIVQISLICFAIPFLAMTVISKLLRRQIDFRKASRRAAAVMFFLLIVLGGNYLSLWFESQHWVLSKLGPILARLPEVGQY